MPLYEYKCQNCGNVNAFFEKVEVGFWERLKRRCSKCGSRKLEKVFSSFAVSKKESTTDMLNEISKMGPVNFVPDYRPQGPPPGGCPYAKEKKDKNK